MTFLNFTAKTLNDNFHKEFNKQNNETILSLKAEIAREMNVNPDSFNLLYKTKVLDDNSTLFENGIKNNETVNVIIKPPKSSGDENQRVGSKISLKIRTYKGGMFNVVIESNQTVQDLKHQIEIKSGIPINLMVLMHQGQLLTEQHDNCTLIQMNMAKNSTITASLKQIGGII
jgi:hypothetical protein